VANTDLASDAGAEPKAFQQLDEIEEPELLPGFHIRSVPSETRRPRNPASIGMLTLVAMVCTSACGADGTTDDANPGFEPDAGVTESSTDAAGDADIETDAPEVISCSADQNVEQVASDVAARVRMEMESAGYAYVALSPTTDVSPTTDEFDRVHTARAEDAVYFDNEAQILALPEDDRLREAYEDGDFTPDWATEGVLSLFRLEPYTDVQFFRKDDELAVYLIRLEACLATGIAPDPEPFELVRRWVYRVPKVAAVETRIESHPFRVMTFEVEPDWSAHASSPVIGRAGGLGSVVAVDGGYQTWINAYSGATGLIYRGLSSDGVGWDFAWDSAHECEFEGVGLFDSKRDPSVMVQDDGFVMWIELDDGAPATRIHRTESADGLHWTAPQRVQGDGMRDLRSPFVMEHDGLLHMWGHDWGERAVVHATSIEGLTWEMQGVVVERGASIDNLDGFGAFTPAAYHDGERWVVIYAAAYTPRELFNSWHQPIWHQMHLAYATSTDGIEWTKAEKPIWSQNRTRGHWESGNIGRPNPLRHGDELWVYYTGVEGGEPSVGLIVGAGW